MNQKIVVSIAILIILGIFGLAIYQRTFTDKSVTIKPEAKTVLSSTTENQTTPTVAPEVTLAPTKGPPPMTLDPKKNYTATLKTSEGNIVISLNAQKTPITVNNFVTLARNKFYDNTIFHRVIRGFMIQGGDPQGTGSGGPGYTFADEPFEGEYTRGTVAMANAGPNTNGSQFFIMHQDNGLPKNYVIFGKVSSGMETVDKIASAPVTMSSSGEQSKPVNPVKILSVSVAEQ